MQVQRLRIEVSSEVFSCFDMGRKPSEKTQPERFYHGFVLELLAELQDHYIISSNQESGLGRYDIMIEPKKAGNVDLSLSLK